VLPSAGVPIVLPSYVTPGNPVEGVWGNQVVNALSDLQDLIDTVTPIGLCLPYGGDTEPANWLFARGQAISRTTYSVLYSRYGTKFGAGNGSTTFNLPTMMGRVPVGYWPGGSYWQLGVGQLGGSFDTPVISHQHGVNIWSGYVDSDHAHSGGTAIENAQHNHFLNFGGVVRTNPFIAPDNANSWAVRVGDGFTVTMEHINTNGANATGVENQNHAHGFSTGGASANHRHAVNGFSDFAGQSGAGANIPPGTSFNFLVRVL
jgi:microcystin-dependent protein